MDGREKKARKVRGDRRREGEMKRKREKENKKNSEETDSEREMIRRFERKRQEIERAEIINRRGRRTVGMIGGGNGVLKRESIGSRTGREKRTSGRTGRSAMWL